MGYTQPYEELMIHFSPLTSHVSCFTSPFFLGKNPGPKSPATVQGHQLGILAEGRGHRSEAQLEGHHQADRHLEDHPTEFSPRKRDITCD